MRAACTEFDRKSTMLAFVKAVESLSEPLVQHDPSYLGSTNQNGIDFFTEVLRGNRNETAHEVEADPMTAVLRFFETAQTTFICPPFSTSTFPDSGNTCKTNSTNTPQSPRTLPSTMHGISSTATRSEIETSRIYSFASLESLRMVKSTISKAAKGHLAKISLRMCLFRRYTDIYSINQKQC